MEVTPGFKAREGVCTHLAGLGIDVAHVEESLDHSHVLLFPPHGGERSQHESRVSGSVLAVNVTDPWERRGSVHPEANTPTWSAHFSPSLEFSSHVRGVVTLGHDLLSPLPARRSSQWT